MGFNLFNPLAIGNTVDITRIDETPIYKLGQRVFFTDTTVRNPNIIGDFAYIFALVDLIQFQPYIIQQRQTINEEYILVAPQTTVNVPISEVAIPQQFSLDSNNPTVAIPAGFYGFALCNGNGIALVDGAKNAQQLLRLVSTETTLSDTANVAQFVGQVTEDSGDTQANVLLFGNKINIT